MNLLTQSLCSGHSSVRQAHGEPTAKADSRTPSGLALREDSLIHTFTENLEHSF